ncbi:phosphoglycerate dehydrogenase [Marinilactibacillus psychrotolerans]|uniref:2-hydroxyacid dehydrogenase n=1 Tax=Marinilactibacillus psychrotolerans TaxID=191770 RepID=A0AAV3WSA9_9LACT|nr:phosphoglycerate dehydrogenase [Marinilactibacillus psychrotolerans]GEL67608.1 2-hydroxyacid dehydrogenase [Marinilactibacillus psychrotolerans]GEQ35508.1 2-hydroxyacid dehydrogenase [Marinilactibacillus psychrotolerans]SDD07661.1 D-3-phosphoglycerate dehydrogenase [Marinilactibacillus psychrotolerans]
MKVVITPRGFANYGEKALKQFDENGIDVDFNQTGLPYTAAVLLKKAKDADGLIVGVDTIDKDFLDACPNLKVICKFGVGTDNIDLEYAAEKNIFIGKTLGTNTNAVAEHVLSLMFMDAKNLFSSTKQVKEGNWIKETGRELKGKTLGIIGFGAIGQRLAKQVSGLGMEVLVYDVIEIDEKIKEESKVKEVSYDEILQDSDYLSLHVPLNSSTKNLISGYELKKMKSTACLVNSARGGVVNEEALLNALKNSIIRSAMFDVFSQEPPVENIGLLKLDQFILTPHTASRTEESEQRTCHLATSIVMEKLLVGGDEK